MTSDWEKAVARWSRLKLTRKRQAHRTEHAEADRRATEHHPAGQALSPPPSPTALSAAPTSTGPVPTAEAGQTAPAAQPAPWPDPATLTAESDFKVFLRRDVPEDVHREAMRALWKSDPLITAHDGLTDYNDDYQNGICFTGLVSTAYRVGKGFLAEAKEGEAAPEGNEPASTGMAMLRDPVADDPQKEAGNDPADADPADADEVRPSPTHDCGP
jgi:hypothetical protein